MTLNSLPKFSDILHDNQSNTIPMLTNQQFIQQPNINVLSHNANISAHTNPQALTRNECQGLDELSRLSNAQLNRVGQVSGSILTGLIAIPLIIVLVIVVLVYRILFDSFNAPFVWAVVIISILLLISLRSKTSITISDLLKCFSREYQKYRQLGYSDEQIKKLLSSSSECNQ